MNAETTPDIRHISIIDQLPVYNSEKTVLTVGCGKGYLDSFISNAGYNVTSTDYETAGYIGNESVHNELGLNYTKANIFDLKSFPEEKYETVICSEVGTY